MATDNTIGWSDLLAEASTVLAQRLGGDRRQEARWLVERISGYSSAELIVNESERVGMRSVAFFDQLLARRGAGEPLQYVLGRWGFRRLDLYVDRSVLIPRPETEIVAGHAIDAARAVSDRTPKVVDLGTGSGAIALSVASEVANAEVWATDVSAAALAVARANLAGLGRAAGRVTLVQGSWYDALPTSLLGNVDVIVSNPPYVAERERADLDAVILDWEPALALFADDDGRDCVRSVLDGASVWLRPGGVVVVEMAPAQTAWAAAHAAVLGLVDVRIVADLVGRDRAVTAAKAHERWVEPSADRTERLTADR